MNSALGKGNRPPVYRTLLVFSVYAVLALAATWPLVRAPAETFPLGAAEAPTVPLLNVWTIWWNADRVTAGWSGYWTAPIFHPTPDTFAFSEPQPLTVAVAPVVWLGGSRVLAYNLYLWASLILNGVFAARLTRQLGGSRRTSAGAGAAMILLPMVHWQLDVLQLVPLWGILWTWSVFLRIARRPTAARGAELGLALGVSFLLCGHHGLFLVALLAGSVATLGRQLLRRQTWYAGAAAGAIAAVLILPVALPQYRATQRYEFERSRETVQKLSAQPSDYLATWGRPLIAVGSDAARPHWFLSPGWIKVVLAAVGAAWGLARRHRRQATVILLTCGLLAFLLSLGPNLRIGGWIPWWTLADHVPGFAQVRNVFRFAYFVQMIVVLLAAQGVQTLWLLARRQLRAGPIRRGTAGLIGVLGLLAIFEIGPAPARVGRAPDVSRQSDWIEAVQRDHTPGRALAYLPFPAGSRVEDFAETTRQMYYATYHGVPLVNGYSGFLPPSFTDLQNTVNEAFPSAEALRLLAEADVELLVVERALYPREALAEQTFGGYALEWLASGRAGVDVYRLTRREANDGPVSE